MNPTVEKFRNFIYNPKSVDQKKAMKIIKKNAALQQLSGYSLTTVQDPQQLNKLTLQASRLGGDDLIDFINSLKQDAIRNHWPSKARSNYVTARKAFQQEQRQEIKSKGRFSSGHTVAWVKIKVLKNLATTAGVTGFTYHFKKLFGKAAY